MKQKFVVDIRLYIKISVADPKPKKTELEYTYLLA
jgi:hypothetical protein